MADNGLKIYTVEIDGIDHDMQLDEATAKQYGDRAKPQQAKGKAVTAPANKARTPTSTKDAD